MNTVFIGIGEMGYGMAKNILEKNKSLIIWNRTKDKPHVNELVKLGAQFAQNLGSAVSSADFVCFNLTEDKAVRTVSEAVLPFIKKGAVILDFSTVSPDTAVNVNAMFGNANAYYLDCPVSGGSAGAEAGTLTIMAGGERHAFEMSLPLFNMCGKNIQYMGQSGSGQKAKLINQLMTWVNQAVVCEGMLLAEKSGIDLKALYKVLSTSWGRSWMLERSVEKYIIPGCFDAQSGLELMVKDFNLISDMAMKSDCAIPIAFQAKEIYDQAMDEGLAKKDPSVIIEVMRKNLKRSCPYEK